MASVLIVDDDPFIRKLVSTTLEDVAGFEPAEAPDGIEALELARSEPPALVFLDIHRPGPTSSWRSPSARSSSCGSCTTWATAARPVEGLPGARLQRRRPPGQPPG